MSADAAPNPALGAATLTEQQALAEALAETSQCLVCIFDRAGRIVGFNRVCEEATGFSATEVVGRDARELVIPPEDHALFDEFLTEVWKTRLPSPQLGQWLTRDGGRRIVAWANRPLLGSDGEPVYLVTAGLDVTERERMIAELERVVAEQSALRRVATLVASGAGAEQVVDAVSEEAARVVGAETAAVTRFEADERARRRRVERADRAVARQGRGHPARRRGHAGARLPRRAVRAHRRLHGHDGRRGPGRPCTGPRLDRGRADRRLRRDVGRADRRDDAGDAAARRRGGTARRVRAALLARDRHRRLARAARAGGGARAEAQRRAAAAARRAGRAAADRDARRGRCPARGRVRGRLGGRGARRRRRVGRGGALRRRVGDDRRPLGRRRLPRHSARDDGLGARRGRDGRGLARRAPARIDDYSGVAGEAAADIRRHGIRSIVAAPVYVAGQIWGALAVGTTSAALLPEGTEERLERFATLIAIAVSSAQAWEELLQSRARVVQASDDERRRLGRNLHDGAQQRLVTVLTLPADRRVALRLRPDTARTVLTQAIEEIVNANRELRDLARGLHPVALSERGIEAALRSLTRNASLAVDLDVADERLPEPIEAAMYYVAAEALANATKYAGAGSVRISIRRTESHAWLEVGRRRRRRRRPDQGLRPARAHRPGRGASRPARDRQRRKARHDDPRAVSALDG